mmetsp:Transcript_28859/g.47831  ORF Transcript_28859/g.47831 Transcript_28859/m.47831 type:complete len:271 (+) Transcript_28859:244-1056(+)
MEEARVDDGGGQETPLTNAGITKQGSLVSHWCADGRQIGQTVSRAMAQPSQPCGEQVEVECRGGSGNRRGCSPVRHALVGDCQDVPRPDRQCNQEPMELDAAQGGKAAKARGGGPDGANKCERRTKAETPPPPRAGVRPAARCGTLACSCWQRSNGRQRPYAADRGRWCGTPAGEARWQTQARSAGACRHGCGLAAARRRFQDSIGRSAGASCRPTWHRYHQPWARQRERRQPVASASRRVAVAIARALTITYFQLTLLDAPAAAFVPPG